MKVEANRPGGIPRTLIASLWLTPSAGGMANTIGRFKQALNADVVSFTDPDRLAREGTAVPGAIHVPADRDWRGRAFTWAPAAARREADVLATRADLFSCHSIWRYHVNWMLGHARRRNRPYWFVPHGVLDPWVFTYNRLYKRMWMLLIGRRFLAGAARVIFATEREKAKAAHIYRGNRGVVIPWPVTPVDLSDREALRRDLRARLGILPAARVLLFMGRLHPQKRPLETITAVARAAPPDLHLIMAGPEDSITSAQCRERAAALGFPRLHLTGAVNGADHRACFAAADGFILLSHRENFGHAAAEAAGAGLPTILSEGVDLNEHLLPLRSGWTVGVEDPGAVERAVREFASTTPEKLATMAAPAAEWVRRELSMEAFAAKLRALAVETVREHGRRGPD